MEQKFVDILTDNFDSTPRNVDFRRRRKSVNLINEVVKNGTNGKIEKLFSDDSVSEATKMILLNTIHFKGDWDFKFDPELTDKTDFHLANGSTIQVDTMTTHSRFQMTNVPSLNAQALRLPYKGDRLSMVVILPNENNDLEKMEAAMENVDLGSIEFDDDEDVELWLPKFKLSSDHNLVDNLKKLDITGLFSEGRADLTGMSPVSGLFVSSVIQKAFVEVNEEGSEAGAASGAIAYIRSGSSVEVFNCNRPFTYLITDSLTGLTLFIGRVANPSIE